MFIRIITSLLLFTSILVIAPIILQYTTKYSKNFLPLITANKYNIKKISDIKRSETTNTLINNLIYISKYINSTLIVKEKRLRLSILGGKYDKSAKYKDVDNKKSSSLARFSHALKHVHRYGDQVRVTINNSVGSLNKESGIISQIISIIKEHPYTYSIYLNKKKIFIPNIDFFINSNDLNSRNNLNYKTCDISNSSYGISAYSTNLNNIAYFSEEDGTGAKTMLDAGSSVYAAAFTKITFQAQIITFNKTSNSFEYEKPTSKEIPASKTPETTKLDSEISEISNINSLKANKLSYFNESETILSDLNSSLNTNKHDLILPGIPVPENPNFLPNYFNKELLNAAEARVKYNHISSFKHNHSLYYPWIFSLPFVVVVMGVIITPPFVKYKYKKSMSERRIKIDNELEISTKLDEIDSDIDTTNIEEDDEYITYVEDIDRRMEIIQNSLKNKWLFKSDKNRLATRLNESSAKYDKKILIRRQGLGLVNKPIVSDAEKSPVLITQLHSRSNSIDSTSDENELEVIARNKNKDESQIAIDKQTKRIIKLCNSKTIELRDLNDLSISMHNEVRKIEADIGQKKYNLGVVENLNKQINDLRTLILDKILNIGSRLKENNRIKMKEKINSHMKKINLLRMIKQKNELHEQANELIDKIPEIRDQVKKGVYSGDGVVRQLDRYVDGLKQEIDKVVKETRVEIDNSIHLRTIKEWIDAKIINVKHRISDSTNNGILLPPESVVDFVSDIENKHIMRIVYKARENAKILGSCLLSSYDAAVVQLRSENKHVYDSTKNYLTEIETESKLSLSKKQDELVKCEEIINANKQPDGTVINDEGMNDQKVRRDTLRRELEDMRAQSDKNKEEFAKVADYHFPKTFLNILDHT